MSKIVTKFKTFWSKLNKKALVASVSILAIAGIATGVSMAWGPDRTTYTLDQINNGALGNNAVLNSIKDEANIDNYIADYNAKNPNNKITTWIGDETQFLNVKEKGTTTADVNNGWQSAEPNGTNPIKVDEGKTYRVRMFVHNNNPKGTDVIAQNVIAQVNMADDSAQLEKTITAYLQGSNTNQVYDEAKFVSNNGKKFNLAYVPGSVEYVNNWTNANVGKYTAGNSGNGYAKLTDNIFSAKGAQIGYSAYSSSTLQFTDGIPGCYQYSGWIFFDVVPQFQETVAIGLNKEVSVHGANDWKESISANPGDIVDFQITYANKGTTDQLGVTIRDILPTGMSYVANSTYVANAQTQGQFIQWTGGDTITANGINASTTNAGFAPVADGKRSYIVKFSAKVNSDIKLDCGKVNTLVNTARVSVTANGERFYNEDPAQVTVQGPDCPVTKDKDPVYICKVLEADKKSIITGSTVKFTVTPAYTNGLKDGNVVTVTPISYAFNYGDGQKLDSTDKNVVNHKYDTAGTYVATAKVQFKVGDSNSAYVGSANCQISIKVADELTPEPVTPPTITETGAGLTLGSVLGGGVLAYGLASLAMDRKSKKNL